MADRSTVEKRLVGALRSAINDHGPITAENVSSAAKRVYAAIKQLRREAAHRVLLREAERVASEPAEEGPEPLPAVPGAGVVWEAVRWERRVEYERLYREYQRTDAVARLTEAWAAIGLGADAPMQLRIKAVTGNDGQPLHMPESLPDPDAGPDPQTAAALTAAAAAYKANLAAFPDLVLECQVRDRTGATREAAVAAAPPTPDTTARVRLARRGGVVRYGVTADPESDRTRKLGPVGGATADGRRYGAAYSFRTFELLQTPDGGRLDYDPEGGTAQVGQDRPDGLALTPLAAVAHGLTAPGTRASDFAGYVEAALAGQLAVRLDRPDGKLRARFTAADGGAYEFLVDPARGHLPLRVEGDRPASDRHGKLGYLAVVEPAECSGGRWFPRRHACVWDDPGQQAPAARMGGREVLATRLDADARPADADLTLTLPARTRVYPRTQTVGQPIERITLADPLSVGPDQLVDLERKTRKPLLRPDGPVSAAPAGGHRWTFLTCLAAGLAVAAGAGLVRHRRRPR